MTDNDLIKNIRERIIWAIGLRGWTDIAVAQKAQPEQQGASSGRSIFIQKIFDSRYGFAGRNMEYDEVDEDFKSTESQIVETTFQISVLARQGFDPLKPTAADILNHLAMAFSSAANIEELLKVKLNILRITQVRNELFDDDESRFEFHPNFDVIIVHNHEFNYTVPKVDHIKGQAVPVLP